MFSKEFKINYSETSFGEDLQLSRFFYYGQETSIADTNCKSKNLQYYVDRNLGWVYLGWNAKIHKYPKYDDVLEFTTAPIKYNGTFGHRGFVGKNQKGEIVFEGEIKIVLFNLKDKEIVKPDDEILAEYDPKMESLNLKVKKVPKTTDFNYIGEESIKVIRHLTDSNRHTNNITYIQYAESFIPTDIYEKYKVSDVVINFRKESYLEDILLYKIYHKEETNEMIMNIFKGEDLICDLYFTFTERNEF